ncbi:hypothetical protein [Streptomyces sp. NRRL S-350]|uniref:hypothetical protein n=1 Tax=Streptomyces sp. NRRL S-350 TaxID=1463902 RepID=UPI00131DBFEF|nr:hypothetical protein [Streptomyces sp. NRRL S-350]
MSSGGKALASDDPGELVEVLHWNVQHGWKMAEALAYLKRRAQDGGRKAAVISLNEVQPGQGEEIAKELGMLYFAPASPPGVSEEDSRVRNGNGLFIDPDGPLVPDMEWEQHWTGLWHPPVVVPTRVRDRDGNLSARQIFFGCDHACYWNPDFRLAEARFWAGVAVKDQRLGHVDADFNAWVVGRAPLSMDGIADRNYAGNRSVKDAAGQWVADTQADEMLTRHGWVYVHGYAAQHLGCAGADGATSGHGPDKERQVVPEEDLPPGGLSAIDRTYITEELLPAVAGAELVVSEEADAISDHRLRATYYDLDRLVTITNRPVKLVRH